MYGESLHQMYRRQTEWGVSQTCGCAICQLREDALIER